MPPLYTLTVVGPDHRVYEGKVAGLVAPGSEGYFGVLARHAPMVAELTAGELAVVDQEGERKWFAVSGGFLEVGRQEVMILVDAAEGTGEIDVERARSAQERAERRLHAHDREIDLARAGASLKRALNRLKVAQKHSRTT